jgi:CHAT domain-containing protein/Tfp pilus assembly protein PilF
MYSRQHFSQIFSTQLLIVLLTSPAFGQESRLANDIRQLELNKPIERTITGEVHEYGAQVTAGELLDVVVNQLGIDVVVEVLAPDGKVVAEFDSPNGAQGPEPVLLIADATGKYILRIRPLEKGASGRYSITFNDRRAPTAKDRKYFDDKEKLAEAQRIENQWWPLYQNGRYADAIPLAERALAIREGVLGPDHPDVALTLNSLGMLYSNNEDFLRAESLLRRSLAIDEKVFGKDHPNLAIVSGNLGTLYFDIGDFAQSEMLLKNALALREKAFGPEHPDVALTLHNLAVLYERIGDYREAERICHRALSIYKKVRAADHPDIARSLGTLGEIYRSLGDYARAEPLYQQALAIYKDWGSRGEYWAAKVKSDLATLYQERGDLKKAESLYEEALNTYETVLGKENATVAQVLNNFAQLHASLGNYERAIELHRRSLEIREKRFGPASAPIAESLHNLSNVSRAIGNYEQAKQLSERAISIWENTIGRNHPHVAQSYSNLAVLQCETQDLSGALRSLKRVNEIEEHNLNLILTVGSEDQKQIYLNKLSGNADYTISLNVRYLPLDNDAITLGLTAVLQRKGRALDAMSDQVGRLRRRAGVEDAALLDRLDAVRARLASLEISGESRLKPKDRADEIARLRSENGEIEASIGRRSEAFRIDAQAVDVENVREALPPGTALVEFVLFRAFDLQAKKVVGEQYAAYVLRADSPKPLLVNLGDAFKIDELIHQWRLALNDPKRVDVRKLGRSLDEMVMRQVRGSLGSVRHLFVSTDGELNLMPFSALVDESNQYLVENYSITYLTSGRDLLRLQSPHNTQSGNVLIVADPLFDLAASQSSETNGSGLSPKSTNLGRQSERSADFSTFNYQRLVGAAAEARELSRLWPSATVWTEDRATEAAVKKAKPPWILHVATHGFFLPNQPRAKGPSDPLKSPKPTVPDTLSNRENPLLRSGLILAGAKQQRSGEGEDGVLTALEMAGLNLWNTKLVVLSACETGLGDVKRGEGVYGLRRALVLAGSESQVMSLWKVSDAGTRDLMTAYYSRLQKGEGRTEALREVQIAMLKGKLTSATSSQGGRRETTDPGEKNAVKNYRHPYYWAAFIQSGDWRNMEGK